MKAYRYTAKYYNVEYVLLQCQKINRIVWVWQSIEYYLGAPLSFNSRNGVGWKNKKHAVAYMKKLVSENPNLCWLKATK